MTAATRAERDTATSRPGQDKTIVPARGRSCIGAPSRRSSSARVRPNSARGASM